MRYFNDEVLLNKNSWPRNFCLWISNTLYFHRCFCLFHIVSKRRLVLGWVGGWLDQAADASKRQKRQCINLPTRRKDKLDNEN